MTDHDLVRCYGLYFAALRGGHAGQALDIYGNDYLMDQVVESGDAALLEKRIIAIHRLKTAVPAGTLARLGAVVGGATDLQVDAVGRYFEGVGVSFQIMDDVLNLRGIYAKEADKLKAGTALKTLGEDIRCGKVTFPIAKVTASLPLLFSCQTARPAVRIDQHTKNLIAVHGSGQGYGLEKANVGYRKVQASGSGRC